MKSKSSHISIDDVTNALQSLSENETTKSIFEVKIFRYVRALHRLFGFKITLYVFSQYGEWSLANIPDRYKQEFEDASKWLKFGFHAVSDEQKEHNKLPNFEEVFSKTNMQIERFAGNKSIAKILRLHYWFYPLQYLEIIKNNGVNTILIKDDQQIESMGLNQWITNVRIEQDTMRQIVYKIWHYTGNQPLVIFTHEWALNKKNKVKLALTVALLRLKGYQFICE